MHTEHKLSAAIAAKYECTITPTTVLVPLKDNQGNVIRPTKRITVDLRTGTLAQAEELVKHGFKYLVPKENKPASSAPKSVKK